MRLVLTVNCAIVQLLDLSTLGLNLPGLLLDSDHDKFCWLERREANHYVDDAEVDIILCRGLGIDLNEVGITCLLALKRALPEQIVHERASGEADLRPQRL